jgi:hypothetical protein
VACHAEIKNHGGTLISSIDKEDIVKNGSHHQHFSHQVEFFQVSSSIGAGFSPVRTGHSPLAAKLLLEPGLSFFRGIPCEIFLKRTPAAAGCWLYWV